MIQTFTKNDLVKHLYQELPHPENQWMNDALSADGEMAGLQQDMRQVKDMLDENLMEPSDAVVDRILAFSRHFPRNSK
ncbi:MAG: hypothetical protein MUD08_12070 [Cytophagales bacterium]|nr:hypothetical protein [Cytophagales bacterium]